MNFREWERIRNGQIQSMTYLRVPFDILEDDLSGDATRALLAWHVQQMHLHSPPGSVFALDLSGLLRPEVTVWTARRLDRVAVGAIKRLSGTTAEIKSMRTHPNHLRAGAASALLEHIIGVAKDEGIKRLSLETGSGEAFESALALYRKHGFTQGEAFADYRQSTFNQFLHLEL